MANSINTVSDFRHALRTPYAWPGGYRLNFVCADGGTLCHGCAKRERRSILEAIARSARSSDQWRVVSQDVHWEGAAIQCDHCGTHLESEYGEPTDETA